MNKKRKFITIFNCMDGRCQHVNDHVLESYIAAAEEDEDSPVADVITEPGIDAILAGKSTLENLPKAEWFRFKAEVSVKHHGANHAIIVGHHACAGNPVDDDEHREHIRESVKVIESWELFEKITGLFVDDCRGIEEVVV
jgi:hypothetical protein